MNVLKYIIRLILGFVGGSLAGLLIAGIMLVCFTDMTLPDFWAKLQSVDFGESVIAAGIGIIAFAFSLMILIPLHEAGHLACGLMSGYRFVSFRIFSFTIIKIGGRLCVKRFAVAGTGGQCLLTPPDLPLAEIPVVWYNFGGVFANILAVIAAIPLLLIDGSPFLTMIVAIFILTGVILILMNGIPMKISGAGNDAYNMMALRKNPVSKRGLVESLRANALIQNGIRPKNMPDVWFNVPSEIDYGNQLEVTIPLMAASRLIDEMKYAQALDMFESIYEHKKEIIGLYVKEIECELVFLRLVCGNIDGAHKLLDDKLKTYILTYRKTMSSKERILCSIYLIMDHDKEKAREIYDNLLAKQKDYLLQGEVKSDLSIMHFLLSADCDASVKMV